MIDFNLNAQFDAASGDVIITVPYDSDVEKLVLKYKGVVNVKLSKPKDPKTDAQNRTAHALLTAFYLSGMASLPEDCTLAKFKIIKKLDYGPVYETEYKGQLVRIPYSFADYSKEQVAAFIDSLVTEIVQAGAGTDKKVQEILKGMEDNQKYGA